MKKLNAYYTLAFLFLATSLFLPAISYAVPAAPSPTCAISATVLSIQKTKTNIAGLGQPPREDFYYYSVKLKIESSSVFQQEGYGSCDNLINKEQGSILSLTEYDKSPVSVGQKMNANIKFGGDEWFNGYFLSGVKIISTGSITHNLYLGLKNSEVMLLQQKLQELGYFSAMVQPTGYFGMITKKAVQDFQKANGVITTGYVGSLTRQALAKYISSQFTLSKCMPADTKLSDVVDAKFISYNSQTNVYDVQKTTVEQKLNELKATCNNESKLVDATGKQITFYRLTGCWGNPPYNYLEIVQKERDAINKFKEQYTVIEMTCNSSGIPIP